VVVQKAHERVATRVVRAASEAEAACSAAGSETASAATAWRRSRGPPTGRRPTGRRCRVAWRLSHKSPSDPVCRSVMGTTHIQSGDTSQSNGTRPPPAPRIARRLPPLRFLSFFGPFTRQPPWIGAVRRRCCLVTDAGAGRAAIARRRTPASRPKQASRATEPRRSLVEEGERFGAAVGRLRCLLLACRSDGRPPRGLTAGRP
jgi:hypothetical protein